MSAHRHAEGSRPCPTDGCDGTVRFREGTPGNVPWKVCDRCDRRNRCDRCGCRTARGIARCGPCRRDAEPAAPETPPYAGPRLRLRLGRTFLDDHLDRFPDGSDGSLRYHREGRAVDTVDLSPAATANLVGDAAHYADKVNGYDPQLAAAARRTLAAIRREYSRTPRRLADAADADHWEGDATAAAFAEAEAWRPVGEALLAAAR